MILLSSPVRRSNEQPALCTRRAMIIAAGSMKIARQLGIDNEAPVIQHNYENGFILFIMFRQTKYIISITQTYLFHFNW